VRVTAAAATDVGRVRANNEDAFLADDEHGCYAVADGMGGHLGGEVASATAIEALRAAVARGVDIDEAVGIANDAVVAKAAGDPELTGMGTTLTALTLGDGAVVLGHVGDSRAYLLRAGELRMVTDDHSLVGELIREGRLTVEQAEVHPQRSVITRCLGTGPGVQVDVIALPVVSGDRIVLCSDGLTTMLRDDAIRTLVDDEDLTPGELARRLVDAACAAGGDDNVTVVVVDIEDVADPSGSVPPPAVIASPAGEHTDRRSPDRARSVRSLGSWIRSPGRRSGLLLLLAPVLVIGIALAIFAESSRETFFIGSRDGNVMIFKGTPPSEKPNDARVSENTYLSLDCLSPDEQQQVEQGIPGTRSELDQRIKDWERTYESCSASPEASIAPSTTTTAVASSTTRPRPPTPTTFAPPGRPASAP